MQKEGKQKAFLEVISTKNQNMSDNKRVTDIQKFIEKFEPSKFKMLSRGIEVRGIKDLNRSISFAKEVIEKLKLKLVISHSAEMAMYGSFEVNYLQH
ncbi:hypothetical protein [Pedobacter alluvionis]|nr:hypothetical protein [Pedobacter alluvionis]